VSSAIATVLGKTSGSLLDTVLDSLLGDFIRGVGMVGKTEIALTTAYLRNITAECLDSLIEAETNSNVGISASGLVTVFEEFMKTVSRASVVMPAEIVEELYTEMLQEGFSNAIQSSVGGALQSILNVWRGGFPINADEISEIVEEADDLDSDTLGLLIAQGGANIPSSLFRIKQGFDRYVDKELISLKTQLFEITNRLNDLLSYKLDRSAEIREAYSKAIALIDMVSERALSRLQELRNECETAKSWYEWSQANPATPIISEEELNMIALENKLEAEAIVNSLNALLAKIDNALTNFDITLDTVLSNIDECMLNDVVHLNKMIQASILDVREVTNRINTAIDMLVAYRNAVDLTTTPTTSIEKSITGTYTGGYATETYTETYTVTFIVKRST